MIYGERIKQVRELREWTQTELAERLGVSQPFVAKVEGGWANPPEEFMSALVFRSGFPLAFFETAPEEGFPVGSLLFRGHADMTEREQRAVYRHAQIAYEIVRRMVAKRRVREVPLHLPRCKGDPERAAAVTRSELGLHPDVPVTNLISIMERAGILVIQLPRDFQRADAFSAWAVMDDGARKPIVVFSSGRPADRLRMSAAHELGHLVMHQPLSGHPSQVENEAKHFASAFLLPEAALRQEVASPVTLDTFVNLKLKWGVSIQGLIVRAANLGLITPRKYRYLFQRLSARGWKTHEPMSFQVPLERPRAVRQIAELVYGARIDYVKLASDMGLTESFVKELIGVHGVKSKRPAISATKEEEPTGLLRFRGRRPPVNASEKP